MVAGSLAGELLPASRGPPLLLVPDTTVPAAALPRSSLWIAAATAARFSASDPESGISQKLFNS